MISEKKVLAIVPARGGSKRLPGKNLMDLGGKPLIAWSIEAGLNSKYIDRVIVSSESEEICKVAKMYGADVPFVRPAELATDESKSIEFVVHALEKLEERYDYVIVLQPTSPLRESQDIDRGIELCIQKDATSVIGVCEAEHSPLWSNTLDESLSMEHFLDNKYNNARSQDLPVFYRINGAFYMSKVNSILKNKTFFVQKNIYAHIMLQVNSVDIDTKLDFIIAQAVLEAKKNREI
jgi:CMP-N-acetylneuraminic acid synthetase